MDTRSWVRGLVALVIAGSGISVYAASEPSLDGTRWQVAVTPDEAASRAGEQAFDDGLIFQDGRFTSTACVPYGFDASGYTQRIEAGLVTFEAEPVSAKEGQTLWSGEVIEDTVRGTLTWVKRDGTELHYSFEGSREGSS